MMVEESEGLCSSIQNPLVILLAYTHKDPMRLPLALRRQLLFAAD
jgi:hypothetical protein